MGIGALKRATDNDIHVFTRNFRKVFVEIEIIAGEKCEAQSLSLNNRRCGIFVAISYVKLITAFIIPSYLARSGMSLEVFAYKLSLSVKEIGGISKTAIALASRVYEEKRIASLGGFRSSLQKGGIIRLESLVKPFLSVNVSERIAVFGQNDNVHSAVALVKHI